MLVAAAVCPCPPLLVPEVAAGAAPELDAARAACADALGVLAAARPDLLVVVGPAGADTRGRHPQGTPGSFQGFGVDLDVTLGTVENVVPNGASAEDGGSGGTAGTGGTGANGDDGALPTGSGRTLPPSLAVAGWLLARVGWAAAPVDGLGVEETTETERCLQAGRDIAGRARRVALLVMGDASASRTLKAPGYLDERAAPFDAAVARALDADLAALRALDAPLARELKAAGRAPWQVLAGAAEGADLTGGLLYEDAPYGVGYLVASWS
ncbi:class III extradiol dioxygenase subunit B-like domain-containing protein [Streptomyces griseoviridis]